MTTSDMHHCAYCDARLETTPPEDPGAGGRTAYDPWKGRLWRVCPRCQRWNPVPLALRWESLEACERLVTDEGRVLLESEHLALIRAGGGELVRVGEAPRIELSGWRYGDRTPPARRKRGFFARLLGGGLPEPSPGGYDPYALRGRGVPDVWLASPFMDKAWSLTTVFTAVPFAPDCPSCGRVMLLNPWHFQKVRLVRSGGRVRVGAVCALCNTEVLLDLRTARPAIRLGLGLVGGRVSASEVAEPAAAEVDALGGRGPFLDLLADERAALGELGSEGRVALNIVLDEEAEAEALEAEWRRAEEIAAIMDGELTTVPGFEDFRARALGEGS